MQAGVVWVRSVLGDVPPRPDPVEPDEGTDPRDYNPIEYWAEEFGWSTD